MATPGQTPNLEIGGRGYVASFWRRGIVPDVVDAAAAQHPAFLGPPEQNLTTITDPVTGGIPEAIAVHNLIGTATVSTPQGDVQASFAPADVVTAAITPGAASQTGPVAPAHPATTAAGILSNFKTAVSTVPTWAIVVVGVLLLLWWGKKK